MKFSNVIGQQIVKMRLIKSVKENRISHAQLFYGHEGVGTLALALAYAQYISCASKAPDDSCGTCPSCIKYQKYIHPDLHFIFPVSNTQSITKNPVSDDFINEWRTLILKSPYITENQWYSHIGMENKQGIINKYESHEIIRKLNLKAFESEYKIMIIWMPEKMNPTAANKLLKMIEEPPAKTLFLMVSGNTERILPTILSRTQILRIPRIREEDLFEEIQSNFQLPAEEIKNIIKLSDGNYIKALEFVETTEETNYYFEEFVSIMRWAYSRKWMKIFDWVERISLIGREKQKSFILFSVRMIRENYLLNMGRKELVRMTNSEYDFSEKFSAFVSGENTGLIVNELNQAYYHIEANGYARIIFLDFALKLIKLIR